MYSAKASMQIAVSRVLFQYVACLRLLSRYFTSREARSSWGFVFASSLR